MKEKKGCDGLYTITSTEGEPSTEGDEPRSPTMAEELRALATTVDVLAGNAGTSRPYAAQLKAISMDIRGLARGYSRGLRLRQGEPSRPPDHLVRRTCSECGGSGGDCFRCFGEGKLWGLPDPAVGEPSEPLGCELMQTGEGEDLRTWTQWEIAPGVWARTVTRDNHEGDKAVEDYYAALRFNARLTSPASEPSEPVYQCSGRGDSAWFDVTHAEYDNPRPSYKNYVFRVLYHHPSGEQTDD